MGGADGDASQRGADNGDGRRGFGAEAADGLKLGNLGAHGLHDSPPAANGSQGDDGVATEDDPEGDVKNRADEPLAVENDGDDAHGLLGIVHPVAEAVDCRGA